MLGGSGVCLVVLAFAWLFGYDFLVVLSVLCVVFVMVLVFAWLFGYAFGGWLVMLLVVLACLVVLVFAW